jgi:hypothetical protein
MIPSIVMTTCDRQPAYVHRSLAALFAADAGVRSVHVLVGGGDAGFLGEWVSDHRVTPCLLSASQLDELRRSLPRARTRVVTRAALELAEGDVVLLQDDVDFAPDWWRITLEALTWLDVATVVLALYSPHVHTRRVTAHAPIAVYPAVDFYGCQGLFMGRLARARIVGALRDAPAYDDNADDETIRTSLVRDPSIELFALVPSVVQHVGEVSAIQSRFHRSPTFGRRS